MSKAGSLSGSSGESCTVMVYFFPASRSTGPDGRKTEPSNKTFSVFVIQSPPPVTTDDHGPHGLLIVLTLPRGREVGLVGEFHHCHGLPIRSSSFSVSTLMLSLTSASMPVMRYTLTRSMQVVGGMCHQSLRSGLPARCHARDLRGHEGVRDRSFVPSAAPEPSGRPRGCSLIAPFPARVDDMTRTGDPGRHGLLLSPGPGASGGADPGPGGVGGIAPGSLGSPGNAISAAGLNPAAVQPGK